MRQSDALIKRGEDQGSVSQGNDGKNNGLETCRDRRNRAQSLEDARMICFRSRIGFTWRLFAPRFTLGGTGGGIAYNA